MAHAQQEHFQGEAECRAEERMHTKAIADFMRSESGTSTVDTVKALRDRVMLALIDKLVQSLPATPKVGPPLAQHGTIMAGMQQPPSAELHAKQIQEWTDAIMKAHVESAPTYEYPPTP